MKTKKRLMIIGVATTFSAAIALSVWRVIFMKKYYNPYKLEYDLESKSILTAFGLILLAAVFLIAALALAVRKVPAGNAFLLQDQFSVFSSAFCGVTFIGAPILAVAKFSSDIFGFGSGGAFYHAVLPFSLLLMIVCGVYFLMNASVRLGGHKAKRFTALLLPVWGIIYVCASYFDGDYIYTDKNRILANVAAISAMLLLLLEARASVGRKTNALTFMLSLTTILLSAVYFIPEMYLTAFWEIKPTVINYLELFQFGMIFHALSVAVNYIAGENITCVQSTEKQ